MNRCCDDRRLVEVSGTYAMAGFVIRSVESLDSAT